MLKGLKSKGKGKASLAKRGENVSVWLALLVLSLGFLGAFAVYRFLGQIFLALAIAAVSIGGAIALVGGKKRERERRGECLEEEFVSVFAFFGIYVENGCTVYGALGEIARFASPEMERRLNDLLRDIDDDKTVAPFVAFASKFSNLLLKEVMVAVYRMVDEGASPTALRQYQALFSSLADEKRSAAKERYLRELSGVSFLPLLASGLTSVLITIGIMAAMGGLTGNVI
ncbi:MAG: hypothetical protein LKG11_00555 [Bacilli bacterium]|jgi:hypothetical protein|nr:hypothetical protein [Bacilli bacterium]